MAKRPEGGHRGVGVDGGGMDAEAGIKGWGIEAWGSPAWGIGIQGGHFAMRMGMASS